MKKSLVTDGATLAAILLLPKAAAAAVAQGIQSFQAAADDNDAAVPFNQTCNMGSFLFDADTASLGVYCNNDNWKQYSYDWTYINLDLCVANNGGELIPYPAGNFSSSCTDCSITWSHVYLTPFTTQYTTTPQVRPTTITSVVTPRWDDLYLGCGACDNDSGARVTAGATLDLNKVMVNDNGTIGCYSFAGNQQHARPAPPKTTTA